MSSTGLGWESLPLGLALTGPLLERWGIVVAVLVTFAPQLLVVLIATRHRGLRNDWQEEVAISTT